MKFQVLELKGLKSLKPLNVFHTLMLGLKMLPAYVGESYEDFFGRVEKMPEIDQEKMIREAALFVELQQDDLEGVLCFAADSNGVPFSKENVRNLGPADLYEIVVAVCMEVAKIKLNFVTDDEKKN